MLILECPYFGVKAEESALEPRYEAHLNSSKPDAFAQASTTGAAH